MFYPRYYHCYSCKKDFMSSDGVIKLPSVGVTCPNCGSNKTKEKSIISRAFGFLKSKK
jgi:DNA-directed RNA polymerase subunit RPC12/RpoP